MSDDLGNVAAALAGIDPTTLPDAALTEHVCALTAAIERLEAARLAAAGEWDARAVWALDAAYSGAGWMAARLPMRRAHAGGMLRTAAKLRTMPATAAALAAGELSSEKARILAGAINARTRDAFARDEQTLVDTVGGLTVDQTADAMRYWSIAADPDGPAPGDHDRDHAHISPTIGGRWELTANLDTECGAIVTGAINAIVEEMRHGRGGPSCADMTPGQLRAAALVEMARRSTAAAANGPGARPLIWVIAPRDGLPYIPGAGPIRPADAARLACDATTCRVVTDDVGRVIDVGRSSREPTPMQRRMVQLRDGGCTTPGCDRPPNWCEVHHIRWWQHGGPTDIANLTLKCSHCHHLIHAGKLTVERMPDGSLVHRRPDGSVLDAPAAAA